MYPRALSNIAREGKASVLEGVVGQGTGPGAPQRAGRHSLPPAPQGATAGLRGKPCWALCGAGWVAPEPAAPLPSARPDPGPGRSAALSWGSSVASGAPAWLPGLRWGPVGWPCSGVWGRGGRGAGGGWACVGSAGHLCRGEQPLRGSNASVPLQAFP